MPTFCRHGRLEENCSICSKKARYKPGTVSSSSSGSSGTVARRPAREPSSRRSASTRRSSSMVVRRLAREADDGYEHDLVPGLRATADAVRLAEELAFSAARLRELRDAPPGLYGEAVAAADAEEAIWLTFLIALVSPLEEVDDPWTGVRAARVDWASGELPHLEGAAPGARSALAKGAGDRTVAAYRTWAARAGGQQAALAGDPGWSGARRFDRAFERLSLPGLGRVPRFEFLTVVGALGLVELEPAGLQLSAEPLSEPTVAAKRLFGIGDPVLLGRRASELAHACEVPIAALDLAFENWNRPYADHVKAGATVTADDAETARIRAALGVPVEATDDAVDDER